MKVFRRCSKMHYVRSFTRFYHKRLSYILPSLRISDTIACRCLACIDAPSVESSVRLIRAISRRTDDLDTISQRLETYMTTFPPHENMMRRLSLHQQRVANTRGEEEFCVTLVFTIAMLCIEHTRRTRLSRAQSAPVRRHTHSVLKQNSEPCHAFTSRRRDR